MFSQRTEGTGLGWKTFDTEELFGSNLKKVPERKIFFRKRIQKMVYMEKYRIIWMNMENF